MERRQYLAGVVAASSIAIAGCGGSGSSGPTGVVEDFVSAVNSGDGEAARDTYHADSPGQVPQNVEQFEQIDYTLNSAETVDEDTGYNADDYENVQEFQLVEAEISISGEVMGEEIDQTQTTRVVVAKNGDGDWKIWEAQ